MGKKGPLRSRPGRVPGPRGPRRGRTVPARAAGLNAPIEGLFGIQKVQFFRVTRAHVLLSLPSCLIWHDDSKSCVKGFKVNTWLDLKMNTPVSLAPPTLIYTVTWPKKGTDVWALHRPFPHLPDSRARGLTPVRREVCMWGCCLDKCRRGH